MNIRTHVRLADYSTMRLGDEAKALIEVTTRDQLIEAVEWAESHLMPILVLGSGSNVIFKDGYDGLVILNRIQGFEVVRSDGSETTLKIGAGEDWDSVVDRTTAMGLTGVEALSAIPGTAGATPVQNVGAYGQEIADTLKELEAFDMQTNTFVTLQNKECNFSYRNSVFKSTKNRRYIIVSITLALQKGSPRPPFYASLQQYLDEHHISEYTPQAIRHAVIAIRAVKLPDPKKIANTGSFFKNPIVAIKDFKKLHASHPDIPHWPTKDGQVKLSAGWLIQHAGLGSYHSHGMKIYNHNALVFVNESAKRYEDLAAFRQEVIGRVQTAFGVILEQEPELI